MRVLSPRGCCWKECVFARSPLVVPAPARVRARVSVCMCMCARICAGVCARAPRAACALDVGAACGLQVHASRARASSERHARQRLCCYSSACGTMRSPCCRTGSSCHSHSSWTHFSSVHMSTLSAAVTGPTCSACGSIAEARLQHERGSS